MKPGHIVVSALVAVLGLAAVFAPQPWLGQRSQSDPAPAIAVPQVLTTTIVVAVRPLRFGTEIKQEHLTEVEWAEAAIPSGSFESISELMSGEGRRAVLSAIEPNEPVLSWKITGPGERATLSAVVDDGMRAISVSINDVLGVTGFVLPGDRVDIMLTRNNYTDVLLQNIKVLAIDQLADERADQPKSGKTATLEVNSIDAQKLTLAQTVGTLSLALRAAGSVEAAAPRRITMKDLGPAFEIYSEAKDGEGEGETAVDLLTKKLEESFQAIDTRINQMDEEFRGTKAIATEAMPFDPNAQVGVIRGMNRQDYRTPKLARAGKRTTLSAVVEDGKRAMSVRIRDTHGIAGFLLPDDRVDVILTRDHYPDILLQNVKILAIDQTADERLNQSKTATATLEVRTDEAQKLTDAQTVGSLSLALVQAIPFVCASLYAYPCYVDGIMGPADDDFSATGCDVSGKRVAKRCRQ